MIPLRWNYIHFDTITCILFCSLEVWYLHSTVALLSVTMLMIRADTRASVFDTITILLMILCECGIGGIYLRWRLSSHDAVLTFYDCCLYSRCTVWNISIRYLEGIRWKCGIVRHSFIWLFLILVYSLWLTGSLGCIRWLSTFGQYILHIHLLFGLFGSGGIPSLCSAVWRDDLGIPASWSFDGEMRYSYCCFIAVHSMCGMIPYPFRWRPFCGTHSPILLCGDTGTVMMYFDWKHFGDTLRYLRVADLCRCGIPYSVSDAVTDIDLRYSSITTRFQWLPIAACTVTMLLFVRWLLLPGIAWYTSHCSAAGSHYIHSVVPPCWCLFLDTIVLFWCRYHDSVRVVVWVGCYCIMYYWFIIHRADALVLRHTCAACGGRIYRLDNDDW